MTRTSEAPYLEISRTIGRIRSTSVLRSQTQEASRHWRTFLERTTPISTPHGIRPLGAAPSHAPIKKISRKFTFLQWHKQRYSADRTTCSSSQATSWEENGCIL